MQSVEALQCHPNFASRGGGASDGSKSMVSQKVLIEKQRITDQKHFAVSLPNARSRRPSSFYQGNINIYIQIHCFPFGFIEAGSSTYSNDMVSIGFTTKKLNMLYVLFRVGSSYCYEIVDLGLVFFNGLSA